MKKTIKVILPVIILSIIVIILYLFFILLSRNPLITDDLTPTNSCQTLLVKSDIIYVIPFYNNDSLSNYPEWCQEMRALNQTFALHGITHEYYEFLKPIDTEKLKEAQDIFEECFGYKADSFRPPYNKISLENQRIIESLNMTIYQRTYIFHPYCHCEPKLWTKLLNWLAWC